MDAVKERPEVLKRSAERAAIGGLSRAATSAAKVHGLSEAGAAVAAGLDMFYDANPHVQNKIMMALCREARW